VSASPALGPIALDLASPAGTAELAAALAELARPGDILALRGELGAGKTAFARAFIRHLSAAPDEEVPSPTFTLVQTYETPRGVVWHFDAYRLKDPDEIWELGFEEALAGGILLIEWPERLGSLLPRDRLDITLAPGSTAESRRATLVSEGADWRQRLPQGWTY
jgi:tRNA threonylcarbamoyladenosine biosynthesis protein TsaE